MTTTPQVALERFVKDLAIRAAKTFGQSFVSALALLFGSAALDVTQIVDLAGLKKFLLSLGVAILAAAFSAAQNTLKGLKQAKYQPYVDVEAESDNDHEAAARLANDPEADIDDLVDDDRPHPYPTR